MAAIDPSAAPKHTGTANGDAPARATLKIIYEPVDPTEDSDDDSEQGYLQQLLQASQEESEDEESSSDEEEKNGGPSDPSKSKKARKQAAVEQMIKSLADESSEDEKTVDSATKTNGALSKVKKGKGKATEEDDESSEDEDGESLNDLEELVLCTLDPAKVCAPLLSNDEGPASLYYHARITNSHLISPLVRISVHISRFLELIQFISLATT